MRRYDSQGNIALRDLFNCSGCDPATCWVFKILGRHSNLETWRTTSYWPNPCADLRYLVFGLLQSLVFIQATGDPGYLSRHYEGSRYNSCYLGWFSISGAIPSALLESVSKAPDIQFWPQTQLNNTAPSNILRRFHTTLSPHLAASIWKTSPACLSSMGIVSPHFKKARDLLEQNILSEGELGASL
jgi:hypothetical protein